MRTKGVTKDHKMYQHICKLVVKKKVGFEYLIARDLKKNNKNNIKVHTKQEASQEGHWIIR